MEQEHKSKIKEDVGIFVKSFLHKASDLDNRITREYGADTTYSDSLHELTSDLNHSIIGLLVYKPNFEDLVFMIANLRHEGKLFIKPSPTSLKINSPFPLPFRKYIVTLPHGGLRHEEQAILMRTILQ